MSNRKAHRRYPSFHRYERSIPARYRRPDGHSRDYYGGRKLASTRTFEERADRRATSVEMHDRTRAANV